MVWQHFCSFCLPVTQGDLTGIIYPLSPYPWLYKNNCLKKCAAWNICWLVFDLKGLTQNLAYVGVVHVGERLEDLAAFIFSPHHEGIHWPFNVGLVVVPSSSFPEDSRFGRSSTSCWPTIIGFGFIWRAIYFLGPWNSQSRNKKRERGKTLIKWQARFKLVVSSLLLSSWTLFQMSAGLQTEVDFLLSGKPDLTGLYFMCYKSEYKRHSSTYTLVYPKLKEQEDLGFNGS